VSSEVEEPDDIVIYGGGSGESSLKHGMVHAWESYDHDVIAVQKCTYSMLLRTLRS
jgi:hypothetical protein